MRSISHQPTLAAVPNVDFGQPPRYSRSVYAIAFDLDVKLLETHYTGNTHTQGYADIRKFLGNHGFEPQQGSVYFGDASVDAVSCVLTVQEMATTYPWFVECVRDIRMLRIEENNDLGVAVAKAPKAPPGSSAGSLFDAA